MRGKERGLQPTLHPNIKDKVLLVQATLQWHSTGVHSGLLTMGDIPVKEPGWTDSAVAQSFKADRREATVEPNKKARKRVCASSEQGFTYGLLHLSLSPLTHTHPTWSPPYTPPMYLALSLSVMPTVSISLSPSLPARSP